LSQENGGIPPDEPSSRRTWQERARQLKQEVYALYLAFRDPRTPWYGKAFTALVVAYAFSPIDLIPDPIPVVGYLDDLILIPLGVVLALKMIPPEVMDEARAASAEAFHDGAPVSTAGAVIVGAIWLALAALVVVLVVRIAR
jgi:uncharacterized membrane protein YkvA (DUF1232 family)